MHRARTTNVIYTRHPELQGLEAGHFEAFVGSRVYYARREFIFAFGHSQVVREFHYRGETQKVAGTNLVIVQPGEPFSVRVAKPIDVSWVHVDVGLVRQVVGLEEGRVARLPYFDELSPEDPVLARLVTRLHAAVMERGPLAERQKLLTDLLARALEKHTGPRPPGRRGTRKAQMQQARDFMQESLSRNVPLSELAEMSGMSVFQFVRSFNREIGLTPHALLIQMRVQKARELLVRGVSATAASAEAGFADPSHLVRHFKRVFKITPGAYATAVRADDAQPSTRSRP